MLEAEWDIGDLQVELAAGVVLSWQAEEAKLGDLLSERLEVGGFEALGPDGRGLPRRLP